MSQGIFKEPVEAYLAKLAVRGLEIHPVFEKMHAEASRRNFPIVGPEVGRVFYQIAALRRPSRVLELGSGFGYSAIWWALGCYSTEVILTDHDQENLDMAKAFAKEAYCEERFHCYQGDALKIAHTLTGPFGVIFVDVDKQQYPEALDFAQEVLQPGGIVVFDNMLWKGEVARSEKDWDKQTKAIVEVTRRIYDDKEWMPSMIPARDGVLIAIRSQ